MTCIGGVITGLMLQKHSCLLFFLLTMTGRYVGWIVYMSYSIYSLPLSVFVLTRCVLWGMLLLSSMVFTAQIIGYHLEIDI